MLDQEQASLLVAGVTALEKSANDISEAVAAGRTFVAQGQRAVEVMRQRAFEAEKIIAGIDSALVMLRGTQAEYETMLRSAKAILAEAGLDLEHGAVVEPLAEK